jgi:hypothetical protein
MNPSNSFVNSRSAIIHSPANFQTNRAISSPYSVHSSNITSFMPLILEIHACLPLIKELHHNMCKSADITSFARAEEGAIKLM